MINCRTSCMKLTFGNMTVDMNIYNFDEQRENPAEINIIFTLQNKHFTNDQNKSLKTILKKKL